MEESQDPVPTLQEDYQAVEKRELLRWASSFVIAAYCRHASFLRTRPPCIPSSLPGLLEAACIYGVIRGILSFARIRWSTVWRMCSPVN